MLQKIKQNKILLIVILLALVVIVSTFGRFIYVEIKKNYFTTQNFYFESDKLKEGQALYQINNYNGVDSYDITVNMNSLGNNKLKATSDIEYDINYQCSPNANCSVNKTSSIIYASASMDNFVVTISPKTSLNDGDIIWIETIAKSKLPYEKEISARFVLKVGYYGLSHVINDSSNSPYLELKITNTLDYYNVISAFDNYNVGDKIDLDTYLALSNNKQKNCAAAIVSLTFDPTIVLLDTTGNAYKEALNVGKQMINGYEYINNISFKIDAISSLIVRFYKLSSQDDYTYPIINNESIVIVEYS